MTKQMSAERTRRATVTAAEGDKQAKVTIAEGNRQAAILQADDDKQAAVLRAEGFALVLSKIFEIARTIDANTLSLQYLETLKSLGSGLATKFVFPMEFASFLKPMAGAMEQAAAAPRGPAPAPPHSAT